jgi:Flp pilus assembly protein TadD
LTGHTLSVAMIVKDEEDCIGDAIRSVSPIADQMVVVDTGSTDNTISRARSLGAEVHRHRWRDDFSVARNESLRHCRCDWVFLLDADEVVAEQDLDRLRALTHTERDVAYRFVARNYGFDSALKGWVPCDPNDPYARGCPGWHASTKTRLFRRHPEVRFEGRIHELVMKSLDGLGIPRELSDVPIHHYGRAKSPERVRAKQAYYLALGKQKVLDNPADAKSHFELGNQLAELGDFEGAVESYKRALEIEPNSAMILGSLGSVCHKLGWYGSAREWYERALEVEPHQADTMRNLGVTLAFMEKYGQAIQHLSEAARRDPGLFDVHRALGTVLEQAGRPHEALYAYGRALESDHPSPAALERFAHLAVDQGEADRAISALCGVLDGWPDNTDVLNSLGEMMYHVGRVEEASSLFRRATDLNEHLAVAWNNLGVAYLSMNRPGDAVDCFKRCLAEEPGNASARANLRELKKSL